MFVAEILTKKADLGHFQDFLWLKISQSSHQKKTRFLFHVNFYFFQVKT